MTNQKQIKRIPRETVEKEREEIRRTEIAMLKIYVRKYPDEARKFMATCNVSFSLTNRIV